ncbi:MAG TPA: PhnD/SsuA/transferrin family substrate-binding protein [Gemmataceae bacterium]|nr:PhnD/SsuA/transferrin family substrate-binding protein [Gemmataceae bacterium]
MRVFGMAAVLLVAAAGLTPPADAQQPTKVKIGLPKGMFRDVPAGVMDIAAAPFRDLLRRQAGTDGDVALVESYQVLATQMKEKKVDIGVFCGFEYAWVKAAHPEIVPLVVTVPNGRKMQAMLVVHKDAKAGKPADLCGACVAIPTGTKPHCHLFLERLRDGLPADCCGVAKMEPKGVEEVLDAVAAGQMQAGLVDIAALTAYQNNKPGAHGQLRVLAQSELFPPSVIAYRKGAVDAATVSRVHAGLTKAGGTPQGKAFMMLWKMKGFEDLPADFDAELKRIAAAYPPPAPPK